MRSVKIFIFTIFSFLSVTLYLSGCNNDKITEPESSMTDDEYLSSTAINIAFSSDADDDDNLFSNETGDFDSRGAVSNNDADPDIPIDSLIRWGRRITNVNVNTNIITTGDSLKNVIVTRTITGNFLITGYINGVPDSTVKPYSQEQKRLIIFKRIQRRPNPRFNWRVYQYSAVDGETKTPQTGKNNIIINKVEVFRNNNLILTMNGPDFTSNIFNARFFGGNILYESSRGDMMRLKVYLTSNQTDTDIVSYHWARNSFGFHRESFELTSQIPNGSGYDRIFEKSIEIYSQHNRGIHNGFISANTKSSLYDNSPELFSSTYMGFPYRIRQ
ncbi:MAG TPA: hypothetical protein PKD83_04950 [Ignavibacteria bacterium]|nr:hypothetical protein [Ignavibacteria bacterium]